MPLNGPLEKYLWTLTLIRQVRNSQEAVNANSLQVSVKLGASPEWNLIQGRLMPDIIFLMGSDHTMIGSPAIPAVVFAPELGLHTTTDENSLDEAIRTTEHLVGDGDQSVRSLRSQVSNLQSNNSRQKGERLLSQLESLLK